ncbi:hypothetical protein V8B97DRAFT_1977255 [Scleroderma yunnanense]
MSQLIRTAKSSSDWTMYDLDAYNISVVDQDATTFFECSELPLPAIPPEVLTAQHAYQAFDLTANELLCHMEHATLVVPEVKSTVDDFVVLLLRAIGHYTTHPKFFRTRKDIDYVICGEYKVAKPDVSIIQGSEILLVFQENKRHIDLMDPVPQLIAQAIAAFAANDYFFRSALGYRYSPLPSKVMPGFIMMGTSPVFYKVLVTRELATAVMCGLYPATPTIVYAHKPTFPNPREQGMMPLDNRRVILSCFEAFKIFVKSCDVFSSIKLHREP